MKTKLLLIAISAVILCGCIPHNCGNEFQYDTVSEIEIFIFTEEDTIQVQSYNQLGNEYSDILYPSQYLNYRVWSYNHLLADGHYDRNFNKITIKKLTNHSESIVIEGKGVIINDTLYSYHTFRNPEQSNVEQCPYPLERVIDAIEINYPELIHRINDTIQHYFNNYQAYNDKNLTPCITIKKIQP